MAWEEYAVARMSDLVYRAGPPSVPVAVLGPVAALDELRAWIGDDHQWADGRWRDWESLIGDVLPGWLSMARALTACTASAAQPALSSLEHARQILIKDKDKAFDYTLRRSAVTQAESELRASLAEPAAFVAAWHDFVQAVRQRSFERERRTLAVLSSVSELQGKPWRPLSNRIWRLLGDDLDEINAIRAEIAGEAPPDPVLPPQRAHEPPAVRLRLAEQALAPPAPSGALVVWLAFVRAHVRPIVVEVGGSVTLYEGRWLRSVLENWDESAHAHDRVPNEIRTHRDVCLGAWETERLEEDFALIRVVLPKGPVSAALDEARATAAALLRLAAFYDRGRSCWRDSGSYMVFVDGEVDWRTLGIEGDRDDHGAALDLARDQTAVKLAELASSIGPHLPVVDPEVLAALDLLRWITEARVVWSPAALLFNDRVLEKVAGWAGCGDSLQFAIERLALAWAFSQATTEIADAGIQAVYSIDRSGGLTPQDPLRRAAFLEAIDQRGIIKQDSTAGDSANLANVVTEIVWLSNWQQPGSDAWVRLAALKKRVVSGPAAARWIRMLEREFADLLSRAKRHRNVIAHGGPITDSSLRTVWRFFDEVASDALNQALFGRLTGQDPAALFDARQQRLTQAVMDLSSDQIAPAEGLLVT